MHYKDAVIKIVQAQWRTCGGFVAETHLKKMLARSKGTLTEFLPQPRESEDSLLISYISELTPQAGLTKLLERARLMQELESIVDATEVSRFLAELELVALLVVVFALGCHNPDVPITDEDIGHVRSRVSDLIAGGFEDSTIPRILEIARRLLLTPRTTADSIMTEIARCAFPSPSD